MVDPKDTSPAAAEAAFVMPRIATARFHVGQVIRHKRFDYRGVIVEVDPVFQGTEEWYEQMAKSRPPKDRPWYHVLVHDARHSTYVAERNLEPETDATPVNHPLVDRLLDRTADGGYRSRTALN